MINLTYPQIASVQTNNLQHVLYNKNAIRAMATQIVAAQVEAHLEMISDAGTKEYSTFAEVNGCILGAKETVNDYIEDLLTDFREQLYAAVRNVNVETQAVILKPDGDIDAEVNVSFIE
jgi:hypothetical protein